MVYVQDFLWDVFLDIKQDALRNDPYFCITEKEYTAQATGWNTKILSLTKLSN